MHEREAYTNILMWRSAPFRQQLMLTPKKLASVRVELKRCSKHLFQDRNAAAVLHAARPLLTA
jgi:hypothetical protein